MGIHESYEEEARSEREAEPPARPLWDGILTFPWQLDALRAWLLNCLGMVLLCFIACGFHALIQVLPPDLSGFSMIIHRAAWHVFTALTILTVLLSIYPAACFWAVVEDTAWLSPRVHWPDSGWLDWLPRWLAFLWLASVSFAFPAVFLILVNLAAPMPAEVWWGLVLLGVATLFPIIALSALAGGSAWFIFHPTLFLRLLQHPAPGVVLALYSVALVGPPLGLAVVMVSGPHWWLAPSVGVLAATCWLIYARVLGRVAWVLLQDQQPRKRRRKKRRKQADNE